MSGAQNAAAGRRNVVVAVSAGIGILVGALLWAGSGSAVLGVTVGGILAITFGGVAWTATAARTGGPVRDSGAAAVVVGDAGSRSDRADGLDSGDGSGGDSAGDSSGADGGGGGGGD